MSSGSLLLDAAEVLAGVRADVVVIGAVAVQAHLTDYEVALTPTRDVDAGKARSTSRENPRDTGMWPARGFALRTRRDRGQRAKRQRTRPSKPGRDRMRWHGPPLPAWLGAPPNAEAKSTNAPVIATADPAEYEAQR